MAARVGLLGLAVAATLAAAGCSAQTPASRARQASPDEMKAIAARIAERRAASARGHRPGESTFGDAHTARLRMVHTLKPVPVTGRPADKASPDTVSATARPR